MSGAAVSVGPLSDVAPGAVRAVRVAGVAIAVVHTADGQVFAVDDRCTHGTVALSEGEVEGCCLECSLHGSRFDLRTGEPVNLPATRPVRVHAVEVRDGDVYVTVNQGDGQ